MLIHQIELLLVVAYDEPSVELPQHTEIIEVFFVKGVGQAIFELLRKIIDVGSLFFALFAVLL